MIRVQNVYYMLAYAFQVLHEQGYKNVATEEFDNVAELLSAILCRGVSVQIAKSQMRGVISKEVFMSLLRAAKRLLSLSIAKTLIPTSCVLP